VFLAAIQVLGSFGAAHQQPERRPIDLLAVLLLLAGPAFLLVRRRPVLRVVGTTAAAAAYLAWGYPFGPVVFSVVVALFLTVLSGRRVLAWTVAAAGWLATLFGSQLGSYPLPWTHGVTVAVWIVVVLVLAEVVRARRERAAAWARAGSEQRRRVVSEERLQIARDLHDGVAHHISLIRVRAGVALHLLERGGEQAEPEARAALEAIRQASGEALGELRSALGLLRAEGEGAPRHPPPGLSALPELAARWSEAGLDVRLDGDVGTLPAPIEAAAYRIVQEALTNVSRHSMATRAEVRLDREDGALTVAVHDPGPARPYPVDGGDGRPAGQGLPGMRERVAAFGGRLAAGPEGPGWLVRAVLPLGSTEPPAESAS
jgi:signal transduction histidine kinase